MPKFLSDADWCLQSDGVPGSRFRPQKHTNKTNVFQAARGGTAASTSFLIISHAFLSSMPPRTHRRLLFLKKTPHFFTPTLALHAATSTSFWDHFTSHASMHPCHLHTRRVVCRSRTHAYRMPRHLHTVTAHRHTRSHTVTAHGHSTWSHAVTVLACISCMSPTHAQRGMPFSSTHV